MLCHPIKFQLNNIITSYSKKCEPHCIELLSCVSEEPINRIMSLRNEVHRTVFFPFELSRRTDLLGQNIKLYLKVATWQILRTALC